MAQTSCRVPLEQTPEYRKEYATKAADDARKKLADAASDAKVGRGMIDTSKQADALLRAGTPTGMGGTVAMTVGNAIGDGLGWLPGVPNRKETTNMQTLRNIGGTGILKQAAELKPVSNTDIAFLKDLQYSVGKGPDYNRKVQAAQQWIGLKKTNYDAGLQAWSRVLGGPDAPSASGETFDQWFDKWAAERLPPPGTLAPSKRDAQNAAMAAKSREAAAKNQARKSGRAVPVGP